MANEEQRTFWTEQVGPIWLERERQLDEASQPFGRAAMDAAKIAGGETVLDIGCGTGPTTVELAQRVGSNGKSIGLDISPLLLGRARERANQAGVDNIEFVEADAQTHPFEPRHDLVFSRFGVMFFADPVAAFTNIRKALSPDGRLVFVTWQDVFKNQWMSLPTMASSQVLGDFELPPEGAPGPFYYADAARVHKVLGGAGYSDVSVDPFETTMDAAEDDAEDRLVSAVRMGPLGQKFVDADDATKRKVFDAVLEAATPHLSGGVYRLPAAAWIVSAR